MSKVTQLLELQPLLLYNIIPINTFKFEDFIMLCPCGSKKEFVQCCQPLLQYLKTAQSPEQLMRSRYTAYVVKDPSYLYKTYAKTSQQYQSIKEIKLWAEDTHWLRLEIRGVSDYINADKKRPATVKFSAYYLHNKELFNMSETSNFIKESNQWRYLDAESSNSNKLKFPKRNESCPCLSGKKFKICCGK